MKKAIYVITGIMASGKSTVADALANRIENCVHLRGDIFRKMIITGREDMSEDPSIGALNQLDMRYSITAKAAIEYYNNDFSVVVQDNYLGEKLLSFLELLEPYPTYVIVLNPDIRSIEQREKMRGKKGYVGFTVDSLSKLFIEKTPRIGLWLDTSNMSIVETVDEILKRSEKEAKYR
ncbi:MAG: Chloramphenicol phosphotransferase-like protein [Anaerocolumna sp.]|jgi:cytidylate kinase|nr:Chloramphenicol phosphotransferase-like protein [Anaerocolumna sp.]